MKPFTLNRDRSTADQQRLKAAVRSATVVPATRAALGRVIVEDVQTNGFLHKTSTCYDLVGLPVPVLLLENAAAYVPEPWSPA